MSGFKPATGIVAMPAGNLLQRHKVAIALPVFLPLQKVLASKFSPLRPLLLGAICVQSSCKQQSRRYYTRGFADKYDQ